LAGGAGQACKKALILRVNDVENNTPFLHMVEDWCRPLGGTSVENFNPARLEAVEQDSSRETTESEQTPQ
jgi:hypothetical protein